MGRPLGSVLLSCCSLALPVQDQLESVLEVLHRQMEQYRDQPQHLEKIAYQQRLLQEDLVHIRAELFRESTVREGCGGSRHIPQDELAPGCCAHLPSYS